MYGLKKRRRGGVAGLWISLIVFALLLSCAVAGFNGIGSGADDEQRQVLLAAVRNAAVTCYAVEGRYPESLAYLEENYGLAMNDDLFVVIYDAFASDVMPDIRVLRKGATLS